MDYVLWGISFVNLVMIVAAIPNPKQEKQEKITLGQLAERLNSNI